MHTKTTSFFKMDDEEKNLDSSLCVICQKDEDTDGLHECSSGIPKLIEYGALFGLKLLVSYLNAKQNEGSPVKIDANCQDNIGNTIRKGQIQKIQRNFMKQSE